MLAIIWNHAILAKRNNAGYSSLVARRAHNPKVDGSNPSPAINKKAALCAAFFVLIFVF